MPEKKKPGSWAGTPGGDGTGVTLNRNNTTTGAKNQAVSAALSMAKEGPR
jgi:hypothetical protein